MLVEKKHARTLFREKRSQLTPHEIQEKSIEIANRLLQLPIWDCNVFHVFLSIERLKEVDTESILTLLMAKDKKIVVSRTDFEKREMIHYAVNENTKFKKSEWGICEPIEGELVKSTEIEVVFVPLLACDFKGNRVGYGKGFYDRFLLNCSEKAIFIGLSFYEPIVEEILSEPTDVKLHRVVTPNKIFDFI